MLSHPDQIGLQPLCTQVVEALAYHLERPLHFKTIGATSLPGSPLAGQVAVHEPSQALAVRFRDRLRFAQQSTALRAGGRPIALLHPSKVLASLINAHLLIVGHGSLGGIFK